MIILPNCVFVDFLLYIVEAANHMTEKVQQRELEAQQVKTQQPRNRIQDPSHRK